MDDDSCRQHHLRQGLSRAQDARCRDVSSACPSRQASRRRSGLRRMAADGICAIGALLLASSIIFSTEAVKLSDTQAMYTGIIRRMERAKKNIVDGEGSNAPSTSSEQLMPDANYVLSFGPDNAEILLHLCIKEGSSGVGLALDPTPEDRFHRSVTCLKEYEERTASSKDPSAGVSSYDPISQVWFHAGGEDGFASAYLTGVNIIKHGSIGQAPVEYEDMQTSFTLSCLEYNRADDSLFGIVTYASGQHYVVAIRGSSMNPVWDPSETGHENDKGSKEGYYVNSDQRAENNPVQSKKTWDRTLTFRHIYRLREATGVVPALSSLEPIRQMFMCIVIEDNDPYLYVVGSGMDQGGVAQACPTLTSEDSLACPECTGCLLRKIPMPGVATSLEVYYTGLPNPTQDHKHKHHNHYHAGDDVEGFVYMLVYNTSGHYFMQLDIDSGILYTEDAELIEDKDTRVAYGLSAFAPNGFGIMHEDDPNWGKPGEPSIMAKKLTTFSYITRTRELLDGANGTVEDVKLGKLRSLSWGAGKDKESKMPNEPVLQRNAAPIERDLTFISFEAQSTTIPVAEETYPLYAHIDGGGFVNVIGGPFVDAPSLSCKWTVIDSFCDALSTLDYQEQCLIYSRETIYINATYIVCVTPPVSKAMRAKITVSLSGVVWSFETPDVFIFFQTGNPQLTATRPPLWGSSKGLTALKIKGVNVNRLSWDDKNMLADSRCEFGDYRDPEIYMTDDQLIFNSDTCENITIGPITELYCAFTCKSPQIPHEYCQYTGDYRLCPRDSNFTADNCNHLCTEFVPQCPRGATTAEQVQGKCRPLLAFNLNVPLRLVFGAWSRPGAAFPEGQRIDYGQFYYTSGGPPVVLGARFTKDISGLIVEFDVSTNRGQLGEITDETIYQAADDLLIDPEKKFGVGAFASWPSRRQVIFSFGKGATITEQTYPEWRPYIISDYFDRYAFIGSGETFVIDPIVPEDKPATYAVISAPSFVSFCSEWYVSAGDSHGGGGRPLSFGWFVSVTPMAYTSDDQTTISNFAECDKLVPDPKKCPAWVLRLQATLQGLNQAKIRAISLERAEVERRSCNEETNPNSCAENGLHVCFDEKCDIRPGYRYSWRVVTYSWLWTSGIPSGLKWINWGDTRPTEGQEIIKADLSARLEEKTEFSAEEVKRFAFDSLGFDQYIKSDSGTYFKPAGVQVSGAQIYACGKDPVPRNLWIRPQHYMTCPAMSLSTSDPSCTESSEGSCLAWATIDTEVSTRPLQELEILGPSSVHLSTNQIDLQLKGHVDTRSLLMCDTGNTQASAAYLELARGRLSGSGSAQELATTLESTWNIMQLDVSGHSQSKDICQYMADLTNANSYCSETDIIRMARDCMLNLEDIPSRRTVTLQLPPEFFRPRHTYYASLTSKIATDQGSGICSVVRIEVADEDLRTDLFMGVYLDADQPKENSMGGQKRGFNFGVDIGNVENSMSAQELRFYTTIENPRTPAEDTEGQMQYNYDWTCRYWKKDLYKYWQASSFLDAPTDVVSDCACESGNVNDRSCLKTWESQTTTSTESMIKIAENKFVGLFNHTLEVRIIITELSQQKIPTGRVAENVLMVTVYNQGDSRFQPYMSHREIILELDVDTSKLPIPAGVRSFVPNIPINIKGWVANAAGERIEPKWIPMGQGKPAFECPGGLPEDVNGIDRICWFEWVELVGTDLTDSTISRFPKFQALSNVAQLSLRPGVVQAESSYVVRLNMVKSLDEGSDEMIYAWFETKVSVNALPRNGFVKVDPACGMGILADFTISAQDWNDDPGDLPLAYAFSYQRLGWDDDPFMFTEFSYSSQISFQMPYSEQGLNCTGRISRTERNREDIKRSEFCRQLQISVHVQNINSATIVATTSVDVWRPQFGTDLAFNRGGKVDADNPDPLPGYEACNGPVQGANLKSPLVFVEGIFDKALAYGFTNKNMIAMDMSLRNAAAFFNNEAPQVEEIFGPKSPGDGVGFKFRKRALDQVFLIMISMKMLPTTKEGMESVTSAVLEIFGHETAKVDVCMFSTADIENILSFIKALMSQIYVLKLKVSANLIRSLSLVANVCTDCLMNGEPATIELLQTVKEIVGREQTIRRKVMQTGERRRQGDAKLRMDPVLKEMRTEIAYEFNSVFLAEIGCGILMDSNDELTTDQIVTRTDLHTFVFRRAYPWSETPFELVAPEFSNARGEVVCGPIRIHVSDGIGGGRVDVCAMVFHYNPKDTESAMSGAFTSDGASQRQYGVPWPLSSSSDEKPGAMCPVKVTMHSVPRSAEDRLRVPVRIEFDLSHEPTLSRNWFQPQPPDRYSGQESHNPPAFNEVAFHDIWFSGICQEWGTVASTQRGSWFEVKAANQTVQHDLAGNAMDLQVANENELIVDACTQMHFPDNLFGEPVPEKIANGTIICHFFPEDADNWASTTGATMSSLYGVVSERADCKGSFSKDSSLYNDYDFDTGQMEYYRALPTGETPVEVRKPVTRLVCDKCAKCGGYNKDCEPGCDGLYPSKRQLDQCGTCGGQCIGACPRSQCNDLILTYSSGARTISKILFNDGRCDSPSAVKPPGICSDIILGNCIGCQLTLPNSCPGCVPEVRQETYLQDSDEIIMFEDEPFVMPPNNLSLDSINNPLREVVMHLCPVNEACQRYLWESGKDLGKTPRCEDLHFANPLCGILCGTSDDYFDTNVFCAAGDFEFDPVANARGTCVPIRVEQVEEISGPSFAGTFVPDDGLDAQPNRFLRASTLWRCTGTPLQITQALDGLKFTPPKLYSSGRPPQSFIYWRFTFDTHDPQLYRKDINVTVLPVNSPPQISGGASFNVQEDRPTILSPSTPGSPGPLSVAILDDAAYQIPHVVTVVLKVDAVSGTGSISIGGSRDPPLCPGCGQGSQGVTMVDSETCVCIDGDLNVKMTIVLPMTESEFEGKRQLFLEAIGKTAGTKADYVTIDKIAQVSTPQGIRVELALKPDDRNPAAIMIMFTRFFKQEIMTVERSAAGEIILTQEAINKELETVGLPAAILTQRPFVVDNEEGLHGFSPWFGPGQSLTVTTTMRLMNQTVLPNLEYMSGANQWEKYIGQDLINVEVTDNGYAQWNQSTRPEFDYSNHERASGEVVVTVEKENDPPVPIMPGSLTIQQGYSGMIVGGHFVDFDSHDYSEDPFSVIYDMAVEVKIGFVTLDLPSANCSTIFPPVLTIPEPFLVVNADGRNEFINTAFQGDGGLYLDGSTYCRTVNYQAWDSGTEETCVNVQEGIYDPGPPKVCWEKQKCNKIPFMKFEMFDRTATDFPSAAIAIRMWLQGCVDNTCTEESGNCFINNIYDTCKMSQVFVAGRSTWVNDQLNGTIRVDAVSCNWGDEKSSRPLTYNILRNLEVEKEPEELGSAFINFQKESWIEISLDLEKVLAHSTDGQLCVRVVADPSIDKTLLLFGAKQPQAGTSYDLLSTRCLENSCEFYERAGYNNMPHPQLVLVRGRSYNCSGSECAVDCSGNLGTNIYSDECAGTMFQCNGVDQPYGFKASDCAGGAKVRDQKAFHWKPTPGACMLHVFAGNALRDQSFRIQGTVDPLNMLLGKIQFTSDSDFNNAMGTNLENLTVSVKDTTATYTMLQQGGWVNLDEPDRYTGFAKTRLTVIPRKISPISVDMVPVYSEPWLQKRLQNGQLPTYVMLEDCGGRPVDDCENCESDCPTILTINPADIEGESISMQFAVEISCKLGTITVPRSLRSKFKFEKGTGFRDSVVRIRGFIPDIRQALKNIKYHTKQDQNVQYKNQYTGRCSRPCFLADIGPSTFENAKETAGCEQSCGTLIYQRVNNFDATVYREEDSGVYLDAIVVTFDDRAATGIGLTTYNKALLYNIYTLAINDRPCSIFADEVTDGCRERCATKILTSGCQLKYDSNLDPIDSPGAPFDRGTVVSRDYFEDDNEAVRLGSMVIKPLDMYDSSRSECRNLLAAELASRGASTYVQPSWMSDCPLLSVKISAIQGEVSLNNRENLNFIAGGSSRFANVIEFIGHPIDCNIAMRMVLYKMSTAAANYNSARGIEQVTFLINDQGYSGADPSGEFEGSSQVSETVVNINIVPVNDLPQVNVPRPTDFIEFKEGQTPLLQTVVLPKGPDGLDVSDVDSFECGSCSSKVGTFAVSTRESCLQTIDPATNLLSEWEPGSVTVELSVKYGRLDIVTVAETGVIPLPDWAKREIQTFLDPDCQEETCRSIKAKGECDLKEGCDWNGKGCWCTKVNPGMRCNKLKMRAPSNAIQKAMSALRYTPEAFYNKLTYIDQLSNPIRETLTVTSTDKRRPDNTSDTDFFCGEREKDEAGKPLDISPFVSGSIDMQPVPINDAPDIGFFPAMQNPSFERPSICEGPYRCEHYSEYCIGVKFHGAEGWTFRGEAGITYHGWTGDCNSVAGTQHVFLHAYDAQPLTPGAKVPSISQDLTGFTLGMEYTVSLQASARQDKQMGCMLNISMIEDPKKTASWLHKDDLSDPWLVGLIQNTNLPGNIGVDTWIQCRPWCELSAQLQQVNPGPSTDPFSPAPTITFVAHSPEYGIHIFADRIAGQPGDRMVFVDDVVVKATRLLIPEDVPFLMEGLQIVDPDITEGSLHWVKSRPVNKFIFELRITAKQGTFNLIPDPTGCRIMPASDNFQIDYDSSMIMNDDERIRFGLRCEPSASGLSEWANKTTFRSPCPPGWVGTGIPPDPCINLPLEKLRIDMTQVTSKIPGQDLDAAKIIPSKDVMVQGEMHKIRETFDKYIRYTGDLNFNTENRGSERLTFTVDDLANVEIAEAGTIPPPKNTTTSIDVFLKAINDAPTIEFDTPAFTLSEDISFPLPGIKIGDVDLNELKCKQGLCPRKKGIMTMKFSSQNGSFSLDPAFSRQSLNAIIDSDYGLFVRRNDPIYANPDVYRCLWRLWCDDLDAPIGSPKLGLDFAAPCAHVPRHHVLEECVEYKMPFCQLVRSILNETHSLSSCRVQLYETALNERKNSMLDLAEVSILKDFQRKIVLASINNPVAYITPYLMVLMGTLDKLKVGTQDSLFIYQPHQDFNGQDPIKIELNDLGNEGMQYPCPTPRNLPERLHLEHCMKTRPYVALETSNILPITVMPVNDKPKLVMLNPFGEELDELLTVNAQQNITRFLPPMRVKDVDLGETPDAVLDVTLSVKGGSLDINASKIPNLQPFISPGGGRLQAKGLLDDINNMMRHLKYRSDPQMLGSDQVLVDIDDIGQTGKPKEGEALGPVSYFISIIVTKPASCQFETCRACVDQILEDCGWCPESCGGVGKCREALPDGSGPLFGVCKPKKTKYGSVGWNDCEEPPDKAWLKGAIGAPVLFVSLVILHTMYMWTRKMHGTIPVYTSRVLKSLVASARKFYLLPPAEASNVQILYVVIFFALIRFLPDVIIRLTETPPVNIELGEATYFNLNADGCDVLLLKKPQSSLGTEQPSIRAWITSNTTGLSDVIVETSTCADVQYLDVNNTRMSSEKYKGYSCLIHLLIPQPIRASAIPALSIKNPGEKTTTITQQRGLLFDMGPSSLTLEGTLFLVELMNSKMRMFKADIQSGAIRMLNMTFEQVRVTTKDAPVLITASAEDVMDVRTQIDVRQNENNICLMSSVSTVKAEAFKGTNNCDRSCENITKAVRWSKQELKDAGFSTAAVKFRNVTEVQCAWKCTKASSYTLMPYRKNPDPAVRSRLVEIYSNSGEIQYNTIPMNRLPPYSGRAPLDRLLIVDGLEDSRKLAIPAKAASVLNVDFHPGGNNRPLQDFFIFNLQGPSRPPGLFVWVSDERYLALPREFLSVISIGVLVPTSMESTLTLSPSECPYFDTEQAFRPQPIPNGSLTFEGSLHPFAAQQLYVKYSTDPSDGNRRSSMEDGATDLFDAEHDSEAEDHSSLGSRRQALDAGELNSQHVLTVYREIYKTIDGNKIPSTSTLAYKPSPSEPFVVFKIDSKTDDTSIVPVTLGTKPRMMVLVVLALLCPSLVAFACIARCLLWSRTAIARHRHAMALNEMARRKLLHAVQENVASPEATASGQEQAKDHSEESLLHLVSDEDWAAIYQQTSFFYFVELQFVDPSKAKSRQAMLAVTAIQVLVLLALVAPLFVFSAIYNASHQQYVCPYATDQVMCEKQTPLLARLSSAFLVAFLSVGFVELLAHYSAVSFNLMRKGLRVLFYAFLLLVVVIGLLYACIVVVWISLGLLVSPARISSITTAMYGLAGVCLRYWRKQSRVLTRVKLSLTAQSAKLVASYSDTFPSEALLQRVVTQEIDTNLQDAGISLQVIARKTSLVAIGAGVILAFLFLGFNAFTDTRETTMGLINFVLTVLTLLAIDSALVGRDDPRIVRDKIVDVAARTRLETDKKMLFLIQQIELGIKLLQLHYAREQEISHEIQDSAANGEPDEDEAAFSARIDRQQAQRREEARQTMRVRQEVAQRLVLNDRLQTFDSSRIWTCVPLEVDNVDAKGNPLPNDEEQDRWEWASNSTLASTQYSTTQASSSRLSRSRAGKSRVSAHSGRQPGVLAPASVRDDLSHVDPTDTPGGRAEAARVVSPEDSSQSFDAEHDLVVLVLDHSQSNVMGVEDGDQAAELDEDSQVLADFWGTGLADAGADAAAVVKIAEVLGCDPSRLEIQWSRVTVAGQGLAESVAEAEVGVDVEGGSAAGSAYETGERGGEGFFDRANASDAGVASPLSDRFGPVSSGRYRSNERFDSLAPAGGVGGRSGGGVLLSVQDLLSERKHQFSEAVDEAPAGGGNVQRLRQQFESGVTLHRDDGQSSTASM